MKSFALPIAIFIAVIFAGFVLVFLPGKSNAPATPVVTVPTTTQSGDDVADLIHVTAPLTGSAVGSTTIKIAGEARGTWYFEASFPVEVRNASGTVIATGQAQATSDWMTENFVPFKSSITYPMQPAGSVGAVVFKNDNPSGDPARDKWISIPVVF